MWTCARYGFPHLHHRQPYSNTLFGYGFFIADGGGEGENALFTQGVGVRKLRKQPGERKCFAFLFGQIHGQIMCDEV